MVGLSAFQGVLGQEVQTHWTHHLAGALQMSHTNIRKYLIHISANIFLKPLSSSPIIYVCHFPWNLDCHCQFKVWVYRTHHLARALQRISNFPVFVFLWFSCICIWNFRVSPSLSCHIHIEFVIFLPASYLPGRRNLCKYVLNCQPNHFLTGAHSNLFSDVLRRISQKFVFWRGDKEAFSNESNSNVCVLWKCDILRQSNIAQQRAFWLLGTFWVGASSNKYTLCIVPRIIGKG